MNDLMHPHNPQNEEMPYAAPSMAQPPQVPQGPGEQASANVIAIVHRIFRGRYKIAIPVILGLAIGGGVAGVLMGGPEYTSSSVVRVRSSQTKILYDVAQDDASAGFRFQHKVQTQAKLMMTDRVLEQALADEAVTDATREIGVAGYRRLLNIQNTRDAPEIIQVSATAPDPSVAKEVVASTVKAYMDIYGNSESLGRPELLSTLEQLKVQKQSEIRSKENQIAAKAVEFGTSNLTVIQQNAQETLNTLMGDLRDEELLLLELQNAKEREEAMQAALGNLDGVGVDEIIDLLPNSARVSDLARQRSAYELSLRDLEAAGVRPNHRRYRALMQSVVEVDRKIREAVRSHTDQNTAMDNIEDQVRLAETRRGQLESNVVAARERVSAISEAAVEIERLETEIKDLRRELGLAEDRYDAIILESKVEDFDEGARVTNSPASTPVEPSGDSRPKLAVAGFIGLGGLGFVTFAGIGLLDRRVRYSDDLKEKAGLPRVLAVLPRWASSMPADEEIPFAVANTIHRVRAQLQWRLDNKPRGALVITSGDSGEGKTSMVMSLGISFAHGGSRVLLVDFDLIGRSLTKHMAAHTPDRLVHAVSSDDPASFVMPTAIENISLLGATPMDEAAGPRFSKIALERFFASLAKDYDVILVDTGPLLGGVEASVVCAASAGVVIVAGRGRPRMVVEQCTEAVRSMGGDVFGMIFNGASSHDFARSPHSQSQSAQSRRHDSGAGTGLAVRRWCPHVGSPLAEIVASTLVAEDPTPPSRRPRDAADPENAA